MWRPRCLARSPRHETSSTILARFRFPATPRDRLELPRDAITPGTRPVVGMIIAAHAESPDSTMHDVRPFAVPPLVLASCLVADSAEWRRSLFPLAVALSRLPTVELAHGTRSETRLEDGAALLEQIRTRHDERAGYCWVSSGFKFGSSS